MAALQRLAFAACFADTGHFALAGGGPSFSRMLAANLAFVPTDVFEVVYRSPVLHEVPGLELIGRASEQGWAWRSVVGFGLGMPARAEVEGMAVRVEEEATEGDDYTKDESGRLNIYYSYSCIENRKSWRRLRFLNRWHRNFLFAPFVRLDVRVHGSAWLRHCQAGAHHTALPRAGTTASGSATALSSSLTRCRVRAHLRAAVASRGRRVALCHSIGASTESRALRRGCSRVATCPPPTGGGGRNACCRSSR